MLVMLNALVHVLKHLHGFLCSFYNIHVFSTRRHSLVIFSPSNNLHLLKHMYTCIIHLLADAAVFILHIYIYEYMSVANDI